MRIASRDQARTRLSQARPEDGPVRLLSPAGAAGLHGIGWWLALVAELERDFPHIALDAVLDCGAAPGHALEALRAGCATVALEAAPDTLRAVADIAAALGGKVIDGAELAARPPPSGGRG